MLAEVPYSQQFGGLGGKRINPGGQAWSFQSVLEEVPCQTMNNFPGNGKFSSEIPENPWDSWDSENLLSLIIWPQEE